MGFTSADAQVRTIPVYIVATALCLVAAWLADRLQHRYAFSMFGLVVAVIGYILLLCQDSVSV